VPVVTALPFHFFLMSFNIPVFLLMVPLFHRPRPVAGSGPGRGGAHFFVQFIHRLKLHF
jgi:hypothetical protein